MGLYTTEGRLIAVIRVEEPPVVWARARRFHNRYFKAPEQVRYQKAVVLAWRNAGRPYFGRMTLRVTLELAYPRPPHSKLPYPTSGKDNDNGEKIVWDALNGKAYVDDGQILKNITEKRWCREGENPHSHIVIEEYIP